MLHELLLALLGFTGDFVLDNSSAPRRPEPAEAGGAADGDAGPAFRLAPDLTFLQPSESSRFFCLHFMSLLWKSSRKTSREDSFLTCYIKDAIAGFQNCKAAFRGCFGMDIRQVDRDEENESAQSDVADKFAQKLARDTSLTSWHSGFHVSLDMLPEYIHMRVAESILFAGKAIRVLRNPSPGATLLEPTNQSQTLKGSHRMQSFIGAPCLKELPNFSNISAEELLPQAEADKVDAMLKQLKHASEFHKRLFESAVSSIRTIAANHLWQLVVVRADLNGHLKALKDYFLLAKGDFFQPQINALTNCQSTAEADLIVPFQLAALKTIGDEDKYFTRVSLRMPLFGMKSSTSQKDLQKSNTSDLSLQGKASSELALDGWHSIALEYSVDWPLQLFFTPDVLSKYRKVFQYLIRLKRTQMELEKSWTAVMHQDHVDFSDYCKDQKNSSATQLRRLRTKPFWRVREHMAFLIRNLQFYIQVDVIESQWNVLQTHVQDSHDFTELVTFHQDYLSALISQSFLDIGSVSRILDSIMKLCLQFCWSIEQYETGANMFEIDHITEEFNKKSNSLYTILRSSRLAGSQRAPFLRQFLMRLNFNSFFETTARGVMNSGRLRPGTASTQL
ncbi:hypothetical protein ZWY2020_058774 [Hordeum vulgare]|nr:hypothetical protein ZWY2020_058774 [Hordeum vulgare]